MSRRVLVVDDSPEMRVVLGRMLASDFEIATADDGRKAIEQYGEWKPHIMLLDMNMPVLDGSGVIDHVRGEASDPNCYIIVLTAADQLAAKADALNRGANDFLGKPFEREELMARINVAVRQVRLTRRLREAHERIASEIDLLAGLQQKLLPQQLPLLRGVRVRQLYRPSGRASGDYYDVLPLGETTLRLVMTDVSGHEARAAFLMAVVRTVFHVAGGASRELGELMRTINGHLRSIVGEEGDFVTLLVADIDFSTRKMNYVNAGHCPAVLYGQDSRLTQLPPTAPLMGLLHNPYVPAEAEMPESGGLFLFTDGFFEWRTPDEEIFGLERFMGLVEQTISLDGPFLEQLEDNLRKFGGEPEKFRDDVTALWVTWNAHA